MRWKTEGQIREAIKKELASLKKDFRTKPKKEKYKIVQEIVNFICDLNYGISFLQTEEGSTIISIGLIIGNHVSIVSAEV